MHRRLRQLLDVLRPRPADQDPDCVERCMEALYDPERAAGLCCGEREEAQLEAERRRWSHERQHVAH
jgi:hypothetical protein